ncbi:MAG: hypothetical protein J6A01_09110 [Proteobacteria bacterium]|nr:hypothetical protein [Pseudomonadota bacterium]
MSKRLTCLIGIICLAFCFCACSSSKSAKSEPVAATSAALTEADPYANATALFYSGKYKECIDAVTAVMNESGETPQGLTMRGISWVKIGKTYSAYRDLLTVTQMTYSADALMNLGTALRMGGFCVRAADAYEKALALRPGDPKILVNLTSAYLCYGNIDAANQTYGQLVGKLPADAIALTVAGIVSAMAENYEQTRVAAQKALEYDAYYRPAYKLLSMACKNVGDNQCGAEADRQYNFLSNRYNRPHKAIGEQL